MWGGVLVQASQAAYHEFVVAAPVNQKLHAEMANWRHGLGNFAKNACRQMATKSCCFSVSHRVAQKSVIMFFFIFCQTTGFVVEKRKRFVAVFERAFLAELPRPRLLSRTF